VSIPAIPVNIKSGGKTRRAAKMAILDADHPDIEAFISSKSNEERKAHALIAAGYDGDGPDSEAYSSIFYQNANNSVRVTDEFMQLAEQGDSDSWPLLARSTRTPVKWLNPAAILHQIAEETWRCGDPGMQFDTTINSWHTCPESARIYASNPCSEYMFLDDTACNLASLNLVKFVRDGRFDSQLFAHAVRILIVAQDILVDHAGYPTEQIAGNSHAYRPLGLGYANLGALLMGVGLPYDSDEGREFAAAITSLMGGAAYRASAEIAAAMDDLGSDSHLGSAPSMPHPGAFPGYDRNGVEFLSVIERHRAEAQLLCDLHPSLPPDLQQASVEAWCEAESLGRQTGFRNSQVTVLAPTGTIGFMMDCDTTGIEPMLGVVVFKKLVGGGHLTLVNQAVETALERLRYDKETVDGIKQHILAHSMIEGAPGLREEHLSIFDCAFRPSNGLRSIHWRGHIRMMAAVQPFLSGAISKTVNLPQEATVAEVEAAYREAWRSGLKAVAIYRDGSKSSQPVRTNAKSQAKTQPQSPDLSGPPSANRHRLQDERSAITHHFSIAGHEGYLTVGLYPNGQPGEIFIRMAKAGSTIAGLMECFGTVASVSLQHGVPLRVLCDKLAHTRFEPSGWTGSEELGYAKSIMDYLFRWLQLRFLEGKQLPSSPARQQPLRNREPRSRTRLVAVFRSSCMTVTKWATLRCVLPAAL
jgi:ribonucleoside-diphosphate reductase alpha chain